MPGQKRNGGLQDSCLALLRHGFGNIGEWTEWTNDSMRNVWGQEVIPWRLRGPWKPASNSTRNVPSPCLKPPKPVMAIHSDEKCYLRWFQRKVCKKTNVIHVSRSDTLWNPDRVPMFFGGPLGHTQPFSRCVNYWPRRLTGRFLVPKKGGTFEWWYLKCMKG